VEKNFWNVRFPVYNKWKKRWWEKYLEKGYLDMLTGFRCSSPMSRNDAINYPVQGAAFHCLLWCMIELQKWLRKNNMRTLIVGQIHDSLVLDFYRKETKRVLEKAKQIMTELLPKYWDWICVPLEVEAELSPVGGSWHEKKGVAI
jgi:DNA polymerase I-like protein with 3'-5' exonuclease and polymerase domains